MTRLGIKRQVNFMWLLCIDWIAQKVPTEEEKDANKVEEEESKLNDLDYLSPYLVNYVNVLSGNVGLM